MIIPLHGTGDHSSKFENWMRWVDRLMADRGEERLVQALAAAKQEDGAAVGTGIKYRAAVAIHNILTYRGISCTTLTLDPCHGKKKWSPKEYCRKSWGGQLVNQPNNKNVKFDSLPDFLMERPAMENGKGGRAEPINLPRTNHIKHGHMGKLRGFSDAEKANGSQAHFGMQIEGWCRDNAANGDKQQVLMRFFEKFMVGPSEGVLGDRKIIAKLAVEVLTGGIRAENLRAFFA